jgi:hypothetical protein
LCRFYYPVSLWIDRRFFGIMECRFLKVSGFPCPTCGGSRSAYYFVTGQWPRAFMMNPGVFVLNLVLAALGAYALLALIARRRFVLPAGFLRRLAIFVTAVILLQWIVRLAFGM